MYMWPLTCLWSVVCGNGPHVLHSGAQPTERRLSEDPAAPADVDVYVG